MWPSRLSESRGRRPALACGRMGDLILGLPFVWQRTASVAHVFSVYIAVTVATGLALLLVWRHDRKQSFTALLGLSHLIWTAYPLSYLVARQPDVALKVIGLMGRRCPPLCLDPDGQRHQPVLGSPPSHAATCRPCSWCCCWRTAPSWATT